MKTLCFLICSWHIVLVLSADENFQYFGNYYKRKSYENANFDELFEDFTVDDQLALNECRFIINKGLNQYFAICDRVEKNKRITKEVVELRDKVDLSSVPRGYKNFTFHSAYGLSNISTEKADLLNLEKRPYFEIHSKIYIPSVILRGTVDVNGANQSMDYEIDDILYTNFQRKKVTSGDFDIKLSRSNERFIFNATKLVIKGMVTYDTEYRLLESEIAKDVARYVPKIVEYARSVTKNVTLSADNEYLLTRKDETMRQVSLVISRTAKFFGVIKSNIPRFSFYDADSSVYYELISGVFELDSSKTNVSVRSIKDSEFELTSLVDGSLTFFVTEKNCTESCHTYGDRATLKNPNLTVTFAGKKIDKASLTFELEPGNSTDDHYLRKPSDNMTENVLTNVSKILSDRLLAHLKLFLR